MHRCDIVHDLKIWLDFHIVGVFLGRLTTDIILVAAAPALFLYR